MAVLQRERKFGRFAANASCSANVDIGVMGQIRSAKQRRTALRVKMTGIADLTAISGGVGYAKDIVCGFVLRCWWLDAWFRS